MSSCFRLIPQYFSPFWRDIGLSGTAQSMVEPLLEIHEATTASGAAAFFGISRRLGESEGKDGRRATYSSQHSAAHSIIRVIAIDAHVRENPRNLHHAFSGEIPPLTALGSE